MPPPSLSFFGILEVWGEPARLRHLPAGLRARAALAQGEGELVAGLGVLGREARRLAEAGDGARDVALAELGPAGAGHERRGLGVGLSLVEALGLGERGRRPLPIAALLQDLADVEMRLGGVPLLDGDAELGERVVELALLLQHRAEHVVGVRIVRLARDGLLEGLDRLRRAAGLP